MGINPDHFTPHCIAVGSIVINWSIIERQVDRCISLFYHKCDGKQFINRIPATKFSEKIKVFNKSLNNNPILINYKNDGLALSERIKENSIERHRIIHGTVFILTPFSIVMSKIIYDNDIQKLEKFEYKLNDLFAYEKKIRDLSSDLGTFLQSLLTEFGIPEFDSQ